MHLWNDYEGTTLAGQWTLGRLLRTEGRSALFSTTKSDGTPAVMRLTESLNDQSMLQAKYQAIQAAGDRYLVAVEGYGDAELEGSPLSYAVLEATQESLAEIVAQRRLAPEETQEVALSVSGGLLALHEQGLVHGLVEPESVLAATDRIKLRSDCARFAPSPEDAELEGAVTRQTDAFGLADVIHQALTQNRLQDARDALALPEPFATIVRNTARGTWGVAEIHAELTRATRSQSVVAAPVAVASVAAVAAVPVAMKNATGTVPVQAVAAGSAAALAEHDAPAQPLSSRATKVTEEAAWSQPDEVPAKRRRGIFIGLGVLVLLILLFAIFHKSATRSTPSVQQTVTPAAVATSAPAPVSAPIPTAVPRPAAVQAKPRAAVPVSRPVADTAAEVLQPGQKVWRVIAYTYNHRDEADGKAASLNRHFEGFHAQVWSKTGQQPYLVTLGGDMSRQQAFVVRARALHAGMAKDVYAQNYAR